MMLTCYVVDTNILYSKIETIGNNRHDIIILDDIAFELSPMPERIEKLKAAGVRFVSLKKIHYEKLKEVLQIHGKNLNLIRLYSNEGMGDVVMIAYILSEIENNSSLFIMKYILVTNDKAAIETAEYYGIECLREIPSNNK